jgi:hypothetical protein
MAICNILRLFGIPTLWLFDKVVIIWYFFTVLVYCVKKNLATLFQMPRRWPLNYTDKGQFFKWAYELKEKIHPYIHSYILLAPI